VIAGESCKLIVRVSAGSGSYGRKQRILLDLNRGASFNECFGYMKRGGTSLYVELPIEQRVCSNQLLAVSIGPSV
jgi:hypothetical protein